MKFKLETLKPLLEYLPEVEVPIRKVSFPDKLLYTVAALLVYTVCCGIPLFGANPTADINDPIHHYRSILASNRGTLMELGISPLVTGKLIMQILSATKIIDMSYSKKDPMFETPMYEGTQKLISIVITVFEAFAYVMSGMYGSELGLINYLLIFIQLVCAGFAVIMLDELLTRGWGFGSGTSLFIGINICGAVVWDAFSPLSYSTSSGMQYEGCVLNLFSLLISRQDRIPAIKEAFYRTSLPNINQLLTTVFTFCLVVFFQGFRVELPVQHSRVRGNQAKYPIKFFYTSNIPIILETALISNIFFFSQTFYSNYPGFFSSLLGSWRSVDGEAPIPSGGLAYYMSPPRGLLDLLIHPIHSAIYILFICGLAALFSSHWVEVSGTSSKDVAKQLHQQKLNIRGWRSTVTCLNKYIPICALTGGFFLGGLTIFADMFGEIGSGTGVLLAVTIIFQYFEEYAKEQQAAGGANLLSGLQP